MAIQHCYTDKLQYKTSEIIKVQYHICKKKMILIIFCIYLNEPVDKEKLKQLDKKSIVSFFWEPN